MTTNTIESIHPHNAYIYKLHFEFDWDVLKPICDQLINSEHAKSALITNGESSHFNKVQPHRIEQFKPFYTWLSPLVKDIFTEKSAYSKEMMQYYINNSWVNVHHTGGKTNVHNHTNTFMVATAYLHLPENGGFFECKDPLEYNKGFYYSDNNDWLWKEIPTISGDVLIFPSWLKHKTQINQSLEDRWVLTTNFTQEFKKI